MQNSGVNLPFKTFPSLYFNIEEHISNPQEKNPFVYAINNPNIYVDHFGLACGPGGWGDVIFPDFNFEDACEEHDRCYDDCTKKKKDCDKDFCNAMNKKCKSMSWLNPLKGPCFTAAQAYCRGVQVGGWPFKN